MFAKTITIAASIALTAALFTLPANAGMTKNGLALNGVSINGLELNGVSINGVMLNGVFINGRPLQGIATGSGGFAVVALELPPQPE